MIEPLVIGFASENDDYDALIYRRLTELVVQRSVTSWNHGLRFSGVNHVRKQLPAFLGRARDAAVQHVVLAVDNDGGSRRHPEHEDSHDRMAQAADPDGCRVCQLESVVPDDWRQGSRHVVVTPVQTLETWLLVLRGHGMPNPVPENNYARRELKKMFWGGGKPPQSDRIAMAMDLVNRQGALSILMERPSFERFATAVRNW